MKTSNKLLTAFLSIILLTTVILSFVFWTSVKEQFTEKRDVQYLGQKIKNGNINSVIISGKVNLHVNQGETAKFDLGKSVDTKNLPLEYKESGDTLIITNPNKEDRSDHLDARLTLPSLLYVEIGDNSNLFFGNFNADSLRIHCSDGKAFANNSNFKNLNIDAGKSARLFLGESIAESVTINASGESQIHLRVENGNLSGKLLDNSELHLTGEINNIEVKVGAKAQLFKNAR